jgi:hypothetical protein
MSVLDQDSAPLNEIQDRSSSGSLLSLLRDGLKRLTQLEYFPIFMVVLLSTLLNFLLVFEWSLYQYYLTSDMHGYWERAVQIFSGNEKLANTWATNAPYYSRVIAVIFTWLDYLRLGHIRLEVMLSLNILLSCFATLSLYLIGLRILKSKNWALWLAGFYAFAYPNLYFNTFLLGEPFAIPVIISALYLVFRWQNSNKIYIAGLILAFGVGIRPSNGLVALPCGLFILFYGLSFKKQSMRACVAVFFPRLIKAGLFSLAFLAVLFTIVAENNRVSDGRLRGITAHSGYNFLLGQTQAHKIVSSWEGLTYGFVPSSVAGNPEYGTIKTNIPLYDSAAFYDEGWKILKANPKLWLEHAQKYNQLFFNNLFPAVPTVKGFSIWFDPYRHITFYMLVFCGLLFITFKEKDTDKSYIFVFGSIFGLCVAALFFYTVTHQYFTNFSYALYVLFFIYLRSCALHFNKYKTFILTYVILVVLGTASYYTYKEFRYQFIDAKVKVLVENNNGPIYRLEQNRNITNSQAIDVNNVEFPAALTLKHRTTGEYPGFKEQFFLSATTDFEVLQAGNYMFSIYADDGYRMTIDSDVIMEANNLKTMDEFKIREYVRLEKGRHSLKIDMFQNGILTGLVGYYRRLDPANPSVSQYEYTTRVGMGNYIGDDSEFTKFYYPDSAK